MLQCCSNTGPFRNGTGLPKNKQNGKATERNGEDDKTKTTDAYCVGDALKRNCPSAWTRKKLT